MFILGFTNKRLKKSHIKYTVYFVLDSSTWQTVTNILVTQKNKGLLSYSVGLGEFLCVLLNQKKLDTFW